jgi:uncharacterized protein (TIGR01777 family)
VRVALTGATGLIGGHLARALLDRGDEVVALVRGEGSGIAGARDVRWNPADGPLPAGALGGVDVVVNLAGAPLAGRRWTADRKRAIRESRTLTTRLIVDALAVDGAPRALVNASAVGYYGDVSEPVDETAPPGGDFLAETCVAWEREALRARDHGVRVALIRTGLVLAPDGGLLTTVARPVKLFAGGPLGSGRQWMPWIHIDDEVGLLLMLIDRGDAHGPVNGSAPEPVQQREFVKRLAEVLHRPAVVPAPAVAIRLALGEQAVLALEGQRAVPAAALAAGYRFRHTDLGEALRDIYG